jgi:hypothetical protein
VSLDLVIKLLGLLNSFFFKSTHPTLTLLPCVNQKLPALRQTTHYLSKMAPVSQEDEIRMLYCALKVIGVKPRMQDLAVEMGLQTAAT